MSVVVPLFFYEFGAVMYFLAAVIGLLLTYFSYKLYRYSGKRQHLLFHSAFIFITAGFVALLAGNIVSFYNFESCSPNCRINPEDPTYYWIRFGNYGYYFTTTIGYILLALSYFQTAGKKLFAFLPVIDLGIFIQSQDTTVLYPFVNPFFQVFHLLSIVLVSYIVFKTWLNYRNNKKGGGMLSLLVVLGFLAIGFYHALMYAVSLTYGVSPTIFALAHFSLLVGFGSLLMMLVRVNSRER